MSDDNFWWELFNKAFFRIIFIGLLLFLAGEVIENSFWTSVSKNLGIALTVSGVVSFTNELVIKSDLIELILEKVNLKKDIDRIGIRRIAIHELKPNMEDYIQTAENKIDIVHTNNKRWVDIHIDLIRKKLLNSNCDIRVILLSPDSPFIKGISEHYGCAPERIKDDINIEIEKWQKLFNNTVNKENNECTLNLYYSTNQFASNIYRFDDKIVNIQHTFSGTNTRKLPTIVCEKTDEKDDLFDFFTIEIRKMVDQAEKIDLE